MKAFSLILSALLLSAPLTVQALQTPTAPVQATWIDEFRALPDDTKQEYLKHYSTAEKAFAQKKSMESLFSLLEAEKIFSKNPGLYNLRGACYIEIRNVDKAIESFKKALELDPDNLSIQFNLAEAAFVKHDYQSALNLFTPLLHKFTALKNESVIPLLQFKRYICAVKLNDEKLVKELEGLYRPIDDTPYYYCVQSIKNFQADNKTAAQENLISAMRIFSGTSALQAMTDAMTESGYIPSPLGQTTPMDNNMPQPEPTPGIPSTLEEPMGQ